MQTDNWKSCPGVCSCHYGLSCSSFITSSPTTFFSFYSHCGFGSWTSESCWWSPEEQPSSCRHIKRVIPLMTLFYFKEQKQISPNCLKVLIMFSWIKEYWHKKSLWFNTIQTVWLYNPYLFSLALWWYWCWFWRERYSIGARMVSDWEGRLLTSRPISSASPTGRSAGSERSSRRWKSPLSGQLTSWGP